MSDAVTTQWWLYAIGETLMWARLRELEAGTADVFDCDGNILVYENIDTARAALLDADYRAFDGLDEDDAVQWGIALDTLAPPSGKDEEALRRQMVQPLPPR
jgi:hypothetical protein